MRSLLACQLRAGKQQARLRYVVAFFLIRHFAVVSMFYFQRLQAFNKKSQGV